MKKIFAIFCGSFNPPTNAHFDLAQNIIDENNNIEKIIFVPVSNKYSKIGLESDEHRYNMLKLVCDKNDKFEVSDIELGQERQPYTIETLKNIQDIYPNKEIYLIMGTDNIKELATWYNADELVSDFKVLVLPRNEDDIEKIIEEDEFLKRHKDSFITLENEKRINLSSTLIREKLKKGEDIRNLVKSEIFEYIEENSLYK